MPASSAVSLGTFGISVTRETLAKKMGTTTSGTWDKTALPVINGYISTLAPADGNLLSRRRSHGMR